MPIPASELRRLLDEEQRREAAHRRLRWERHRRQCMWWLALAGAVALLILGVSYARADSLESPRLLERIRDLEARVRSLEEDHQRLTRALLTFELPQALSFAGEAIPLDRWDVRERLEREVLLSLQSRGQVILWLKRAARYFPYMEEALRQRGLPDDLKYVAVIESSLLPLALSRANAGGIWQFIPGTARRYGLRVTPWWDERRDPEFATRAALSCVADLHREFGRWPLALAAYNSGEARVRSALGHQRVQSYFQLALPEETERYVFRAYAAKLILAEPEQYGFHVPDEERYQPPPWDRVDVQVRGRLTVGAIADAWGSFYREVKRLNPGIARDSLPAGSYSINLPEGAGGAVRSLAWKSRPDSIGVQHRVQRGDTLSAIARRYDVTVQDLRKRNPHVVRRPIRPGDILLIHVSQ